MSCWLQPVADAWWNMCLFHFTGFRYTITFTVFLYLHWRLNPQHVQTRPTLIMQGQRRTPQILPVICHRHRSAMMMVALWMNQPIWMHRLSLLALFVSAQSLNPSYYCVRHGIIVSERKRTRTVAELSAELEIPRLGEFIHWFLFQQSNPQDPRVTLTLLCPYIICHTRGLNSQPHYNNSHYQPLHSLSYAMPLA